MPAAYSKDLCEKVIIKHFGLHQSITKVAEDLVVSEGFCRSVRTLWEQGRAFWKQGKRGTKARFRKFDPETLGILRSLVEQAQTLYLDVIQEQLQQRTGKNYSLATLCRGLREAGYTRKKVTCRLSLAVMLPLLAGKHMTTFIHAASQEGH